MKKYDTGDKVDKKDRMGWVVCSRVEWWARGGGGWRGGELGGGGRR